MKRKISKLGNGIRHISKEENGLTIGILNCPKDAFDDAVNYVSPSEFDAIMSMIDYDYLNVKPIKAIAIADERDTFNKETGYDIVDLKLSKKYYEKLSRQYTHIIWMFWKLSNKLAKRREEINYKIKKLEKELEKY